MRYLTIVALLLFYTARGQAQTTPVSLSYADFIAAVAAHHPISQQIRLLSNKATAELQRAKGAGFDPQLVSQWDTKQFSQSQYYSLFATYVKLPTWYGVEVEAGYLLNQGVYLDPENRTPVAGQAYLGVKVPLLQGLITNERRTAVEQARLLQSANAQQIRASLNDLLYQSVKTYWDWAAAYQEVQLWAEAESLAVQRLAATRISVEQGDKPGIDTLESLANVLDRQIRLGQAQLALQQAELNISNFLWSPQQSPLQITPNTQPDPLPILANFNSAQRDSLLGQINSQHPDLQTYAIKLQQLSLEQKLKRNKILPKLDFKYNFLSYNHVDFFATGANAFAENYKFGFKFSMPLLLRESRADLQLTQIKIQETNFQIQQKQIEVGNKIKIYFAEIETYGQQMAIIERNVANYATLLDAEQQKFAIGESSVFLLNSREIKLIEVQQKRIEIQSKLAKAEASFIWAAAMLVQ
jgi:outer membrane protein TolC